MMGSLLGYLLYPNMNIFYISYYKIFFFTVILSCFINSFIISKKNRELFVIIFLNWILSIFIWNIDNVYIMQSILDTITSIIFIFIKKTESRILSIVFAVMSIIGYLTYCGVIRSGHNVFFGMNYPDLLAILGHLASIILGISCGDMGIFRRLWGIFRMDSYSRNRFFSFL
jgi:hypothetical protein